MSKGTTFSNVYPYCLTAIEDEKLNELFQKNPAYFYRKMWFYLQSAIPKFTQPTGIQRRLKYVAPVFADKAFTADGSTAVFDTGIIGMELATISVNDQVVSNATYNPVTGIVTFTENPVAESIIDVDLYTDGYFLEELDTTVQSILGTCFELVWFTKFMNNWLDITPKAQDKNFKMPNEAAKEKADTERAKFISSKLSKEMSDYEQTLAYEATIPEHRRLV